MGAKSWMLICSDDNASTVLKARPEIDREKTLALAQRLFPNRELEVVDEVTLEYTAPDDNTLFVGSFGGLDIIAAYEFGIDYPSTLPDHYLNLTNRKNTYLHAMHSVVDWCAYAHWEEKQLKRSVSVSPDSGILEDIGEKYDFEKPFWAGRYPAIDPEDDDEDGYPFQFHPLELGEAALENFTGFVLEGHRGVEDYDALLEPSEITLLAIKRGKKVRTRTGQKPWWKFW